HRHLSSVYVVFVAVHDGPDRLVAERPAAGKDAEKVHRIERLPLWADEERRNAALDGSHATGRLAVARCDSVPDTPDVFPALPTDSIKEAELQVVCFIAVPAVGDVDHVAGFQPF